LLRNLQPLSIHSDCACSNPNSPCTPTFVLFPVTRRWIDGLSCNPPKSTLSVHDLLLPHNSIASITMGFSNAFRAPDVTDMADNSTASITQLPANLLEAFIPGYSVISKFVLEALDIDITLVVSVCLLMFGLITASTFLWRHTSDLFEKYCMSAISVESHDDIYDHVMAWLSARTVTRDSRSLMAKTGRESA
jgi:hypothetical protein